MLLYSGNIKNIAFSLLFVLIGWFLTSCDNSRVYETNVDINDNVWSYSEIPQFEFEIADGEKNYNIYLNVRNGLSYPFRNLYVKYRLKDSTATVIDESLFEVMLFDPNSGKPNGSGIGDIFDSRNLLRGNYQFPYAGKFTVEYEQYMRKEDLPYIVSLGVRVELAD